MQRYRIAPWILLIFSAIYFTLAVPVPVQDIHGLRVNTADAAEDRIAALPKRMDDNAGESSSDESASDVTSEYERPYHGGPQSETESNTDPDAGSAPESDSELDAGSESDVGSESESGLDSDYSDSNSDSDDGGENGGEMVGGVEQEQEAQEDQHQSDEEEDPQPDVGDQSSNDEAGDHEQSPPHSPELQYPDEGFWSKLLRTH